MSMNRDFGNAVAASVTTSGFNIYYRIFHNEKSADNFINDFLAEL